MPAVTEIKNHVLEGVNYVVLPAMLNAQNIAVLSDRLKLWSGLSVEMHVLDFKAITTFSPDFVKVVRAFTDSLKVKNVTLISVNMNEATFAEIKKLGLESVFNRLVNYPDENKKTRKLNDGEMRRLLFKYLAQAAYAAVEVSLNSTVSCDENYSAKPEEVPLDQFDLITVISVNCDFLKAEFRLCSSASVLDRLAKAMLGQATDVNAELVESMALELLNMVYGHAKSNLNDKESFNLPAAIPRILRKGEFHRIRRSGGTQVTIMPMVTPMGSFYVEVDFGVAKSA